MHLAKALKVKNKLISEIVRLKELIEQHNSFNTMNKPIYETKELLAQLLQKLKKLAELKTKIAAANIKIYDQIFLMAEYKGIVSMLEGLNTRAGKERAGFGEHLHEVEYDAQIPRVEADTTADEYRQKIEECQDTLDTFNATAEIEFELV